MPVVDEKEERGAAFEKNVPPILHYNKPALPIEELLWLASTPF
jgi:hypothetical protein